MDSEEHVEEAAETVPTNQSAAIERRVEEVTETDVWVSLIGTVISRNLKLSSITLDDGTGQVDVKLSTMPELGSLVRVIARVFSAEGGVTLDAIIVQDFSSFDVEIYRRIVNLEERVFSREGDSHRQG